MCCCSSRGHFALTLKLRAVVARSDMITVSYRKLKDIDIELFMKDLKESPLSSIDSVNDVDCMVKIYNDSLASTLDNHAPLITRQIYDRSNAPWYTPEIGIQKQTRRRLERKWLKSITVVDYLKYRDQCLNINKSVVSAKAEYISSMVAQSEGNAR